MTRIQELAAKCMSTGTDFAIISGKLLNQEGTGGYFSLKEADAKNWRPCRVAHYLLGRMIPDTPPPTFDEAALQSGIGNKTVQEAMQHRLSLTVPQRSDVTDPQSLWYQEQIHLAEGAARVFATVAAEQKSVRMLTIATSYPAAGMSRTGSVYVTQHFPLIIEDKHGELIWEHAEAERICSGHRIASATPTVTPHGPSSTWYEELRAQCEEDGIPSDKIESAIRRRRIRHHIENENLSQPDAEKRTDEELQGLRQAPAANVPAKRPKGSSPKESPTKAGGPDAKQLLADILSSKKLNSTTIAGLLGVSTNYVYMLQNDPKRKGKQQVPQLLKIKDCIDKGLPFPAPPEKPEPTEVAPEPAEKGKKSKSKAETHGPRKEEL